MWVNCWHRSILVMRSCQRWGLERRRHRLLMSLSNHWYLWARRRCRRWGPLVYTTSPRLQLVGYQSLRIKRIWPIWINFWIQKILMSAMTTIQKIRYIEFFMTVSVPGPSIILLRRYNWTVWELLLDLIAHLKDLEAERAPHQEQRQTVASFNRQNIASRMHKEAWIWNNHIRLSPLEKQAPHNFLKCVLLMLQIPIRGIPTK